MDHSMLHIMTVGEQLDRAGFSYMFHNEKQMTVSFKTPEGCKSSATINFSKSVWKDNGNYELNNNVIIPELSNAFQKLSNDGFNEKPNASKAEKEDVEREARKYRNTANLLSTLEERNNLVRNTVESNRVEIYSSYPNSVMVNDSVRSLLETHWDDDYSLSNTREQMSRDNLIDMEKVISEKIEFPESSLIMFDFAEDKKGAELSHVSNDLNRVIKNLHEISEDPDLVEKPGEEYIDSGHMAVYVDMETNDLMINTEEPLRGNHTYVIRDVKSDFPENFSNGDKLNESEIMKLFEHSIPIGEEIAKAFDLQNVLTFGLSFDDPDEKMFFPLSIDKRIEKCKDFIKKNSGVKSHFAETDIFDKSKTNPDLS